MISDTAFLVLGFLLLTLYWTIRGLVQIFQRHNAILVILYIIFLFPIAYLHMLILGIFASSKKERMLKAVQDKVEFDQLVEEEKEEKMIKKAKDKVEFDKLVEEEKNK